MSAPNTLDGAYLLHLLYHVDWSGWNDLKPKKQARLMRESARVLEALCRRGEREESGALYHVLGHKGDLMFVFARQTSRELAEVERQLTQLPIWPFLMPAFSYYSVVELSLHGMVEHHRKQLAKQGLEEGTPEWEQGLEALLERDRQVQRERLYPEFPKDDCICFYPMDKRRGESKNWFMLSGPERASLMAAHGKTGRKYAGKVIQIVSSSMGLDDYDWGVSLFAQEPLWFKKLIYEMRYDEVSAVYAEFGPFMIGLRVSPDKLFELCPWEGEVSGPPTAAEE